MRMVRNNVKSKSRWSGSIPAAGASPYQYILRTYIRYAEERFMGSRPASLSTQQASSKPNPFISLTTALDVDAPTSRSLHSMSFLFLLPTCGSCQPSARSKTTTTTNVCSQRTAARCYIVVSSGSGAFESKKMLPATGVLSGLISLLKEDIGWGRGKSF